MLTFLISEIEFCVPCVGSFSSIHVHITKSMMFSGQHDVSCEYSKNPVSPLQELHTPLLVFFMCRAVRVWF